MNFLARVVSHGPNTAGAAAFPQLPVLLQPVIPEEAVPGVLVFS